MPARASGKKGPIDVRMIEPGENVRILKMCSLKLQPGHPDEKEPIDVRIIESGRNVRIPKMCSLEVASPGIRA